MNKPNSEVYFAKCYTWQGDDMRTIKIGLSHRPDHRVEFLKSEMPFRFELLCQVPGDMFLEYFVHIWLKDQKISREYFKDCEEIAQIVEFAKKHRRLPFPIKIIGAEGTFSDLRPLEFMARHKITFKDITEHTGLVSAHYEKLLETSPGGNRRFLAALSVTAVRMGHKISWAKDFKPESVNLQVAA